jgi:hypothetical protein
MSVPLLLLTEVEKKLKLLLTSRNGHGVADSLERIATALEKISDALLRQDQDA